MIIHPYSAHPRLEGEIQKDMGLTPSAAAAATSAVVRKNADASDPPPVVSRSRSKLLSSMSARGRISGRNQAASTKSAFSFDGSLLKELYAKKPEFFSQLLSKLQLRLFTVLEQIDKFSAEQSTWEVAALHEEYKDKPIFKVDLRSRLYKRTKVVNHRSGCILLKNRP